MLTISQTTHEIQKKQFLPNTHKTYKSTTCNYEGQDKQHLINHRKTKITFQKDWKAEKDTEHPWTCNAEKCNQTPQTDKRYANANPFSATPKKKPHQR